jgi:hypothetical protein
MPCVDPAAFRESVRQRQSAQSADSPAGRRFTVSLSQEPGADRYVGTVQHWQGNQLVAQREVNGQVCSSVVDALTLIVAVALEDPERALGQQTPRVPAPEPPPPPAPVEPPPAATFAVGLQLAGAAGSERELGGGPFVSWTRGLRDGWFPAIQLGVERHFSQTLKGNGSELDLATTAGWVGAVPYALQLSPGFTLGSALRFDAGQIAAEGRGTDEPSSTKDAWLSIGVGLPLAYDTGHWRFELGPALGLPLTRPRYFIVDEGQRSFVHTLGRIKYLAVMSVSYRVF